MLCSNCGHHKRQGARFCDACATRLNAPQGDVQEPDEVVTGLSADFVGRQRELAQLTVALDEAASGRGRLDMLVGEPGIGKTRLVQELARIAEDRGAQIFWGRCYEGEGAPPYWPWLQILRVYVQQAEEDELFSVLRLVAAGRTDREIADELFISVRTASTHVRNILNKTDSANRTEAATYAGRHDLI